VRRNGCTMIDSPAMTDAQIIEGQVLSGPRDMLTWTKQKPSKPGWYWMLDPKEAPGVPLVVQIVISVTSETTSALFVLVPASIPKGKGMALDLEKGRCHVVWSTCSSFYLQCSKKTRFTFS
jgi:hypothetical protein